MAFRTALSGLDAASQSLGVIADNIANNNTTGFKQSKVEFGELVDSNSGAGSSAGIGVAISSIKQTYSQGNVGFTGNPLDLAISGSGFFQVSDAGQNLYSRNGAFGTDAQGFVVNAQNQRLRVYEADAQGTVTGTIGDLQLGQQTLVPRVTSEIEVNANLDAASAAPAAAFDLTDSSSFNNSTSVSIYDSLGAEHSAGIFYRKTAASTWDVHFAVDGAQIGAAQAITFDTAGQVATPVGGVLTSAAFTPIGAAAMTIDLNLSQLTQHGASHSLNFLSQDGYGPGSMTGSEVDETGVVFARFNNDQSQQLGQLVLANFTNLQGLTRQGDNNWSESFASGPPLLGAPGTGGLGLITASALEGSNVDLTDELVNLIDTQRYFQANAQVISATDTLTQTILNIG